jgi:HTH-like domain
VLRRKRRFRARYRSALLNWNDDWAPSNWKSIFQAHLRACQGSDAESGKRWRGAVYRGIEASLSLEGKGLTVGWQCELAGVSRSGFYRYLQQEQPKEEDLLLRERLQLAVAHGRKCGYRRLTALLRREGYLANRKRVLRVMQEDNLLSLRKAKYVLTTDSQHDLPVYPHLTRRLTLTGLNQLWIADITYIRLRSEFVFSGGSARRLFATRHRMGAGPQITCGTGNESIGDGAARADLATRRADSPLRSWSSVRVARVHEVARCTRNPSQHEPTWKSV